MTPRLQAITLSPEEGTYNMHALPKPRLSTVLLLLAVVPFLAWCAVLALSPPMGPPRVHIDGADWVFGPTHSFAAPCPDPLVEMPNAEPFRPGGPTFTVLTADPSSVRVRCV